jgi:hypothetical protein
VSIISLRTGVENLPVSSEVNRERLMQLSFLLFRACCGVLTVEQTSMVATGLLAIID